MTPASDIPSRSSLRSSSNCDLVVPRTSRKIGDRAFSVATPRVWNRLPTDLKLLRSTASFKNKLKCFLFHAAYTWNTMWTLECTVGLIVGGALQVVVVTVTVTCVHLGEFLWHATWPLRKTSHLWASHLLEVAHPVIQSVLPEPSGSPFSSKSPIASRSRLVSLPSRPCRSDHWISDSLADRDGLLTLPLKLCWFLTQYDNVFLCVTASCISLVDNSRRNGSRGLQIYYSLSCMTYMIQFN